MTIKDKLRTWFNRMPAETASDHKHVAAAADPDRAVRRRKILLAYTRCLEHRGSISEIRDVSELPFTKDETFDAIASEILETEDGQHIEALKEAAIFLADFQHDVGPVPLTLMGMTDIDMLKAVHSGDRFVDPLAVIERNPNKDKYRLLRRKADHELAYIVTRLGKLEQRRGGHRVN